MDFGMGIGYNPVSTNSSSTSVPGRSAAVDSLRTGMMTQFRSSFVAASSNPQNQGMNNSSSAYPGRRPALSGFVSGGTIGGDAYKPQSSSTSSTTTSGVNPTGQSLGVNANSKNTDRYGS